jgi:hypothetical protein
VTLLKRYFNTLIITGEDSDGEEPGAKRGGREDGNTIITLTTIIIITTIILISIIISIIALTINITISITIARRGDARG